MDVKLLPSLLALSPPTFIHIHDPFDQLSYHAETLKAEYHIEIDCIECISPRVLYTRIINGLASWSVSWGNACECWGGKSSGDWSASWDSFIQAFTVLARQLQTVSNHPRFTLLLRNADMLREILPNLMVPLARLSELSNSSVVTIFCSKCPWVDIRPAWGSSLHPLLVVIPPLTAMQTISHLISLFPSPPSTPRINIYSPHLKPLYEHYIQALYSACALTISDPRQLAYIAAARWPGFVSPVLQEWRASRDARRSDESPKALSTNQDGATSPEGDEEDDDIEHYPLPTTEERMRLLHHFKPSFSSASATLYPRLKHARAWARQNAPPDTFRFSQPLGAHQHINRSSMSPEKALRTEQDSSANTLLQGLTMHVKLMLVASYVASFNPMRTDARMFQRTSDGTKKRLRKGGVRKTKRGTASKLSRSLAGPSPFPLDRFLAIYEALCIEIKGDRETFDREVTRVQTLTTVAELVGMQLLQRTGADEKMDGSTMLKTSIDLTLSQKMAKQLKQDLSEILWDIE